eukprot:scaffold1878_cov258-Pinguiococcus_pyrenoidosus.AAC.32
MKPDGIPVRALGAAFASVTARSASSPPASLRPAGESGWFQAPWMFPGPPPRAPGRALARMSWQKASFEACFILVFGAKRSGVSLGRVAAVQMLARQEPYLRFFQVCDLLLRVAQLSRPLLEHQLMAAILVARRRITRVGLRIPFPHSAPPQTGRKGAGDPERAPRPARMDSSSPRNIVPGSTKGSVQKRYIKRDYLPRFYDSD